MHQMLGRVVFCCIFQRTNVFSYSQKIKNPVTAHIYIVGSLMTTDTVLHFLEQTKEASKPSNLNHLRKNMYTYNQIYIEILFFSFLQINVLISANQRIRQTLANNVF